METLKTTLCYYFPILETLRGSQAEPQVVRELNDLFNSSHQRIPSELNQMNTTGRIGVFEWQRYPRYVIKVEVPGGFKTFAYYQIKRERFRVEENSLELRVKVADQMRKLIEEENLDRLYVPKKWNFSHGVVAEKLDLLSWDETDRRIKGMPLEEQKALVSQIWKIVYLLGHQDLNLLMLSDGRMAVYDTEPCGITLEKVESLRPQAMMNFINGSFFTEKLKLEVIQDFFKEEIAGDETRTRNFQRDRLVL